MQSAQFSRIFLVGAMIRVLKELNALFKTFIFYAHTDDQGTYECLFAVKKHDKLHKKNQRSLNNSLTHLVGYCHFLNSISKNCLSCSNKKCELCHSKE